MLKAQTGGRMLMEDKGRPPCDAEYKIGSCIVRMHGTPDREKLKEATAEFLKAVQRKERQTRKDRNRGDAQT